MLLQTSQYIILVRKLNKIDVRSCRRVQCVDLYTQLCGLSNIKRYTWSKMILWPLHSRGKYFLLNFWHRVYYGIHRHGLPYMISVVFCNVIVGTWGGNEIALNFIFHRQIILYCLFENDYCSSYSYLPHLKCKKYDIILSRCIYTYNYMRALQSSSNIRLSCYKWKCYFSAMEWTRTKN